MIEIEVCGGGILLKPLDRSQLNIAAELYNCSCDIKYATGIASPVTCLELSQRLDKVEESKNEFQLGVFLNYSKHVPIYCHSQLAGVVSGILYDKMLWIKLIAILPQFRHLGIGRRTVGLLLQYSKAYYGITDAFLSAIEKNVAGVRFWRSQGFSEVSRFEKALFEGEELYGVVILNKRL